ncbi:MAG: hypothetical protein A2X94_10065 [Bdellovibrionales bacterium GWB1_55_8]|nr:MAG: hypothetical protein A2X94_10065 [Bdellovibrionales bacterium GWB1_55_8]
MTQFFASLMIIALVFSSSAIAAGAPDCDVCSEKLKALGLQEAVKEKHVALLGKNREYLAALSADQASKVLKVQSNTFLILKKLDVIKAEIRATESDYQKEGCLECPQKK